MPESWSQVLRRHDGDEFSKSHWVTVHTTALCLQDTQLSVRILRIQDSRARRLPWADLSRQFDTRSDEFLKFMPGVSWGTYEDGTVEDIIATRAKWGAFFTKDLTCIREEKRNTAGCHRQKLYQETNECFCRWHKIYWFTSPKDYLQCEPT